MAKPFRMKKAERRIPLNRKKMLLNELRSERREQLEKFIKQKDMELALEKAIPEISSELLERYSSREAPAHLLIEVHAKIIDALGLPESKARMVKKNSALGLIAGAAYDAPVRAEGLLRVANRARMAANALFGELKGKHVAEGVKDLQVLQNHLFGFQARLKTLLEKNPNARIMISHDDSRILQAVLDRFSSRYLTEEQVAFFNFESKKARKILEPDKA
jgi:hypothetical protein